MRVRVPCVQFAFWVINTHGNKSRDQTLAKRGISSVGRALCWRQRGPRIDTVISHCFSLEKLRWFSNLKNFLFGRKTTILCNLTVTIFGIDLESGAVTTHSFNCRVQSISLTVSGKRFVTGCSSEGERSFGGREVFRWFESSHPDVLLAQNQYIKL